MITTNYDGNNFAVDEIRNLEIVKIGLKFEPRLLKSKHLAPNQLVCVSMALRTVILKQFLSKGYPLS